MSTVTIDSLLSQAQHSRIAADEERRANAAQAAEQRRAAALAAVGAGIWEALGVDWTQADDDERDQHTIARGTFSAAGQHYAVIADVSGKYTKITISVDAILADANGAQIGAVRVVDAVLAELIHPARRITDTYEIADANRARIASAIADAVSAGPGARRKWIAAQIKEIARGIENGYNVRRDDAGDLYVDDAGARGAWQAEQKIAHMLDAAQTAELATIHRSALVAAQRKIADMQARAQQEAERAAQVQAERAETLEAARAYAEVYAVADLEARRWAETEDARLWKDARPLWRVRYGVPHREIDADGDIVRAEPQEIVIIEHDAHRIVAAGPLGFHHVRRVNFYDGALDEIVIANVIDLAPIPTPGDDDRRTEAVPYCRTYTANPILLWRVNRPIGALEPAPAPEAARALESWEEYHSRVTGRDTWESWRQVIARAGAQTEPGEIPEY